MGTLRLWERQGLICPDRTAGRARRYREQHMATLRRIVRLRTHEGLPPRAIARLLRDESDTQAPPDPRPVPPGEGLGPRLREARQRLGHTLKEVSTASGHSVSFLSAIERGESGISLTGLQRLTEVYGLTVGDLIAPTDAPLARVAKVGAGRRVELAEGAVQIEQLTPHTLQLGAQLYVIPPGSGSEGTYAHAGQEIAFVLDGALEVTLSEREVHQVGREECISFDSSVPHSWHNPGDSTARVLWINSPVSF